MSPVDAPTTPPSSSPTLAAPTALAAALAAPVVGDRLPSGRPGIGGSRSRGKGRRVAEDAVCGLSRGAHFEIAGRAEALLAALGLVQLRVVHEADRALLAVNPSIVFNGGWCIGSVNSIDRSGVLVRGEEDNRGQSVGVGRSVGRSVGQSLTCEAQHFVTQTDPPPPPKR